jgi:hypothetical protein
LQCLGFIHGALSQTSRSSSVVKITGMVLGWIGSTNCIELMISEYGEGGFGLTHGTRDLQNFPLLGAAINKIANKNCLSGFWSERALEFSIA